VRAKRFRRRIGARAAISKRGKHNQLGERKFRTRCDDVETMRQVDERKMAPSMTIITQTAPTRRKAPVKWRAPANLARRRDSDGRGTCIERGKVSPVPVRRERQKELPLPL